MSKRHFSIGEVARETDYSTETIRRLERKHGLINPERVGGQRVFSESDVEKIRRWKQAQAVK
jgi:DNA-binding transcriptional MerR regulator